MPVTNLLRPPSWPRLSSRNHSILLHAAPISLSIPLAWSALGSHNPLSQLDHLPDEHLLKVTLPQLLGRKISTPLRLLKFIQRPTETLLLLTIIRKASLIDHLRSVVRKLLPLITDAKAQTVSNTALVKALGSVFAFYQISWFRTADRYLVIAVANASRFVNVPLIDDDERPHLDSVGATKLAQAVMDLLPHANAELVSWKFTTNAHDADDNRAIFLLNGKMVNSFLPTWSIHEAGKLNIPVSNGGLMLLTDGRYQLTLRE